MQTGAIEEAEGDSAEEEITMERTGSWIVKKKP